MGSEQDHHNHNQAPDFSELKEAIEIARDYIGLVEELCVVDAWDEFPDMENLTAEDLEYSSPAAFGRHEVVPSDGAVDNVTSVDVSINARGDKGQKRQYEIGLIYEFGNITVFRFTQDASDVLNFDKFEVTGIGIIDKLDNSVANFQKVTRRIRKLKQDGHLVVSEDQSY